MAIGVGTTDKLLGKVADGVSALTDSNKKSDKQLTRAIEYNTFIAEKAEDNRIAQAEQTFENAKETLREFNENKRINLKNQKRFENLLENGKLEGKRRAEAEAKLRKLREEGNELQKQNLDKRTAFDDAVATIKDVRDKGRKSEDALVLEGIDKQIEIQEQQMKEGKTTRKDERDLRRLQKKKFQQELKMASPAEREEMLKDQAAKDKKMLTTLQRIGMGLKGQKGDEEKGDSMFTGPLKFLKGILLKGALLAFIMFLPKILDSKFMRDAIDFMQKTVIPQLKKFYEDAIVPLFNFFIEDIVPVLMKVGKFLFEKVLPIITVLFVKQIEVAKKLFGDIVAAFEKIFSGDILGGIMDLILGIGDAIFETIDNLITAVFNIIASIFGLEGTDSVFGSIAGFFKGIYDTVVEKIGAGIQLVVDAVTGIKDFFVGIYDKVTNTISNAIAFVKEKVDNFLQPIKDFFGKIGEFFSGLLDFDIRGFASKFLPKKAVDFLLGKDEEEAKQLAAAEESGLFEKRGMLRDSKIDKNKVKFAAEGQLKAILADDDLAEEDKRFIEDELRRREVGARPQDSTSSDMQSASQNIAAMKMGGGMLNSGAAVDMRYMGNQIDDFGGVDRAMREAALREELAMNIVTSDNSVKSNSSNTIVQSETITPTYSGYGMTSSESDF